LRRVGAGGRARGLQTAPQLVSVPWRREACGPQLVATPRRREGTRAAGCAAAGVRAAQVAVLRRREGTRAAGRTAAGGCAAPMGERTGCCWWPCGAGGRELQEHGPGKWQRGVAALGTQASSRVICGRMKWI